MIGKISDDLSESESDESGLLQSSLNKMSLVKSLEEEKEEKIKSDLKLQHQK